jgi:hypothetical protein
VYGVTVRGNVTVCTHYKASGISVCHKQQQVKIKVPLTDPKTQNGGRGIALLFLELGARRGWVVSVTPRPLYPRGKPGTHCIRGWVGPRDVLEVYEKFHPHREFFYVLYCFFRSPDLPACSQSLYRLSYPSPHKQHSVMKLMKWNPLCLVEHSKANRLLSVEQTVFLHSNRATFLHVHSLCGIQHVYINLLAPEFF